MARLTEQEQQEIIRFMEAGKPLPDKYRFLLFEDKREVELVWNGNGNWGAPKRSLVNSRVVPEAAARHWPNCIDISVYTKNLISML